MNCSINHIGLQLKNPIIVAAGPWGRDSDAIQKSIDAGAAAVVTETITLNSSIEISPRIFKDKNTMLNTTLYSPVPFESWEEEFNKIDKKGSYIIANIRGNTPSELAYIARCMEKWGADALELMLFTPTGAKIEDAEISPAGFFSFFDAVRREVSIPFMVRIPCYMSESPSAIKMIEASGASGIVTNESLKALWGVDINNGRSRTPAFGGLSGEAIFPVTLASIATLSQNTSLDIAATGGIRTPENIIECIMLGANVIEIGSAVMLTDYKIISDSIQWLEAWMEENKYSSYDEIKGIALNSLHALEDLHARNKKAFVKPDYIFEESRAIQCSTGCLMKAISISDNSIAINRDRCNGCGLCAAIAPDMIEIKSGYVAR